MRQVLLRFASPSWAKWTATSYAATGSLVVPKPWCSWGTLPVSRQRNSSTVRQTVSTLSVLCQLWFSFWNFKTWCSTTWVLSARATPLTLWTSQGIWVIDAAYSIFRNYAVWALFVSSEGFHGASQVVEQCQVVVLLGASTGCSCASGRWYAFWLQQEHSNCAAEFRAKGPCAHSHIY